MSGSTLFSLLVIAVGWASLAWHILQWQALQRVTQDDAAWRFARNQFRRRLQTSSLIVLLGLGTAIEPWVRSPLEALIYWSALLVLVVWLAALALGDMILSRQFLTRQRHDRWLEDVQREAHGRLENDGGQRERHS